MMGRRGLNQTQLAQQLGVTTMWLSRRIRTGQVAIDVATLAQLADVLDCSVSDLLPRLDSNQQPSGYPLSQVSDPFGDAA